MQLLTTPIKVTIDKLNYNNACISGKTRYQQTVSLYEDYCGWAGAYSNGLTMSQLLLAANMHTPVDRINLVSYSDLSWLFRHFKMDWIVVDRIIDHLRSDGARHMTGDAHVYNRLCVEIDRLVDSISKYGNHIVSLIMLRDVLFTYMTFLGYHIRVELMKGGYSEHDEHMRPTLSILNLIDELLL